MGSSSSSLPMKVSAPSIAQRLHDDTVSFAPTLVEPGLLGRGLLVRLDGVQQFSDRGSFRGRSRRDIFGGPDVRQFGDPTERDIVVTSSLVLLVGGAGHG